MSSSIFGQNFFRLKILSDKCFPANKNIFTHTNISWPKKVFKRNKLDGTIWKDKCAEKYISYLNWCYRSFINVHILYNVYNRQYKNICYIIIIATCDHSKFFYYILTFFKSSLVAHENGHTGQLLLFNVYNRSRALRRTRDLVFKNVRPFWARTDNCHEAANCSEHF